MLQDPNFDRTVILVLEHGAEGAVGVVLNRPTDIDLVAALPDWYQAAAEPAVVFVGGPVGQGAVLCLGQSTSTLTMIEGWQPVVGSLGLVDLSRDASEVLGSLVNVRVFSGYAGWGQGQLEGEIGSHAWVVVDSDPSDALSSAPEDLWRLVVRRQRGTVSWLADFPDDPSLN